MPVPDLLASLGRGEDGNSVAYPDTFIDDLSAEYAADMEIPTAKIAVLESDLAAALSQIDVLKAHNYDLMTQVPVENTSEENETDDESDDENESGDEESDLDKVFGG